jgi:formate dehydrogenase subunit gamma
MRTMPRQVPRYDFTERAIHWMSAISFLYATFTGLAMWSHKLWWLSAVFGGGVATREWHPWSGVIFALVQGFMFRQWAGSMKLDDNDKIWLQNSHKYAMNQEEGLPEVGRFNAGQKMLFWFQAGAALVLFLSGVVLWYPELMPRTARLAAILIHPAAGLAAIGLIIIHVYMGTAAVPGAFRAMINGAVSEGWARAHHPKWLRDLKTGR